ncbi:Os01g0502101 [Oryza sativa Japonica Group]|uniref:Os01g0502101 protein n=1 Tax=Oryza sativa subsp. japonica TaxID=39947 RepID=A0A0P0V3D3_ORYSJ|nr:Os01g0502101 [Oryza sativa Japonica Group]
MRARGGSCGRVWRAVEKVSADVTQALRWAHARRLCPGRQRPRLSNGRTRGSEEERGGGGDSQGGFIAAESSLGAESAESLMNAYCEKDSGRMRLDETVDGRMR